MSKKTVKTRTLDNATKLFFKNTKKLFDKLGFIRTKNVFQALDDPADVAKILKHAENTPELTHLLVKNNPKDSLKILDEVATQPNSKKLLKKIVQKKEKAKPNHPYILFRTTIQRWLETVKNLDKP